MLVVVHGVGCGDLMEGAAPAPELGVRSRDKPSITIEEKQGSDGGPIPGMRRPSSVFARAVGSRSAFRRRARLRLVVQDGVGRSP